MKVFLDDVRNPPDWSWTLVKTVKEVIDLLKTGQVTELSLDHDLGTPDNNGEDVIRWMEEYGMWPVNGVHVHSANPVGVARMRLAIQRHYECNPKWDGDGG